MCFSHHLMFIYLYIYTVHLISLKNKTEIGLALLYIQRNSKARKRSNIINEWPKVTMSKIDKHIYKRAFALDISFSHFNNE